MPKQPSGGSDWGSTISSSCSNHDKRSTERNKQVVLDPSGVHLRQPSPIPLSELRVGRLPGLEHYLDLNQPVTRSEADAIGEVVGRAVASVSPGAGITLIGGFRR